MASIQTVHNRIKAQLEKENLGYLSPEEIDEALDRAQLAEFHDLFGNPQEYQPGRPVPRKAYGMTQKIHDDLTPFKKVLMFNGSNFAGISNNTVGTGPNGVLVLPANYLHTTALVGAEAGVYYETLSENELADRLGSAIFPPTTSEPVAVLEGKGGTVESISFTTYYYQLYPKEGQSGYVYYLRRPVAPSFAYSIVNRQVQFDANASIDLEWNDPATERIINKAVSILADKLQADRAVQYAEMKDQKGL